MISKFKGIGKKLATRGEIFKTKLLTQEVYFSANGFLKIRIPREDMPRRTSTPSTGALWTGPADPDGSRESASPGSERRLPAMPPCLVKCSESDAEPTTT